MPKVKTSPTDREVRQGADPDNYLRQTPVWRFSDFDWDGDFGLRSVGTDPVVIRKHLQKHVASFETMTWSEILRQSGGRSHGNNHHPIEVGKFKKPVRDRLREIGVHADTLFSLRLDQATRLYGVREGNCLRFVFFDPFHTDRQLCAYDFA